MTPGELIFVQTAAEMARAAAHVFPEMAACEAALESAYGRSLLAIQDKNLFAMKAHGHPRFGTAVLPSREFENGEWKTLDEVWMKYESWDECFQDRMQTLIRLAPYYPHYAHALDASDAETYVREVSATWSTDPNRAQKVLAIYQEAYGVKA